MKGHLTIIGCGTRVQDLTPLHIQALDDADVLAGGRRLLNWFPDFQGETLEIGKHVRETVAKLFEMAREQRVAVLASGDPLFFGIGARFVDASPDIDVTILPNVSAAQQALARLALPWSEARFFSVHGRKARLPWRQILAAATTVIYTDPKHNPAIVAKELIAFYPPATQRMAAVAENLGSSERISKGNLKEIAGQSFSGLAVLVLLPPDTQEKIITPPLSLGEEDCHFAHQQGLITHPEVRAVVLSKLRLGAGVLWDLGAGSGSVAVEACGLCPDLSAYAVEKDSQRVKMIEENARRAGLASCHVTEGNVLENMEGLPAPRAVFVGGGGNDVGRIVEGAFAALRPGGRLVASAVLLGSKEQLQNTLEEARIEIVELEIRRATPVGPGQMMKPDNPVTLYIFEKKAE